MAAEVLPYIKGQGCLKVLQRIDQHKLVVLKLHERVEGDLKSMSCVSSLGKGKAMDSMRASATNMIG